MEITVRDWKRSDLSEIQRIWLDYCRNLPRSDMRLSPDSRDRIGEWFRDRFKQPSGIGFIAEADATLAGFLIGRIDEWDSVPPIIEPRRIGMIDAVYVHERL